MNHIFRSLMLTLLIFATIPVHAEGENYSDVSYTPSAETTSPEDEQGKDIELIKEYLHNIGLYWGYFIESMPQTTPQNTLLAEKADSADDLKLIAQYTFFALFGANPVNTFFAEFLPTDSTNIYVAINAWANSTFTSYETPSHSPVSVNALIDQQTYQKDPVNQAVLNILGTPDSTFCMDYNGTNWNSNCALLYQNKVMRNVTGPLPSTEALFSYEYQQKFVSQLNSNTLISPLLYSETSNNTNTTSSSSSNSNNSSDTGLTAKSQVENAANFIRYATGAVEPMTLIKRKDYDKQWAAATTSSKTNETNEARTERENAQASLTRYLNSVRIYAAQSSVAISNLYYILSKRLPQPNLNGTSQALNELTMSTRRIYNPEKDGQQWLDRINKASPVTVEREMALLLSEINYQLYLNRQQEERILLTNSLLLIQNLSRNQPEFVAEEGTVSQ